MDFTYNPTQKFTHSTKKLYTSSYTTLIYCSLGDAGADPPTSNNGTFFLCQFSKKFGTLRTLSITKKQLLMSYIK